MDRRTLGRTGLHVSAIGLGTARIRTSVIRDADSTGPAVDDGIALLRAAADLGATHVDTADGYDFGAIESVVGRFLRQQRSAPSEPVVVTTKVGWNFYDAFLPKPVGQHLDRVWGPADRAFGSVLPFDHSQNFSFDYLDFAVSRSLERLGLPQVDILLLHVPSLRALRETDWDIALRRLHRMGRFTHYGVSVREPIEVAAALEHGRPDVIQVPVGVNVSVPMVAVLRAARRRGVGLVGRELFGGGALLRHLLARATREHLGPGSTGEVRDVVVRSIIDRALSQDIVDAVVVGCTHVAQVRECFGAPNVAGTSAVQDWLTVEAARAATESGRICVPEPDSASGLSADMRAYFSERATAPDRGDA